MALGGLWRNWGSVCRQRSKQDPGLAAEPSIDRRNGYTELSKNPDFCHFECLAKVQSRLNISAFWRSLRAFLEASIGLLKGNFFGTAREAQRKARIFKEGFSTCAFRPQRLALESISLLCTGPRDHPRGSRRFWSCRRRTRQ
jgi:hypothetical protein